MNEPSVLQKEIKIKSVWNKAKQSWVVRTTVAGLSTEEERKRGREGYKFGERERERERGRGRKRAREAERSKDADL